LRSRARLRASGALRSVRLSVSPLSHWVALRGYAQIPISGGARSHLQFRAGENEAGLDRFAAVRDIRCCRTCVLGAGAVGPIEISAATKRRSVASHNAVSGPVSAEDLAPRIRLYERILQRARNRSFALAKATGALKRDDLFIALSNSAEANTQQSQLSGKSGFPTRLMNLSALPG